jgi:single-strand DNA-binding protein
MNMVIFGGFLGADPEIRTNPGGKTVATFRIASTKSWKDQAGQRQERTEWATCVVWGPQAELAQRALRKGSRCQVVGELQTRSWDDKATGTKRYATEIQVSNLELLDRQERQEEGRF